MNINLISGSERVLPSADRTVVPRHNPNSPPSVDLSGSEALNRALDNLPDVRQDRVEKLRPVATSLHYPPEELIRGISRLIAEQLAESEN